LPKFKPSTWAEKKLAVLWLRFLSEIPDRTTQIPPEFLEVPEIREACALSEESAYSEAELDLYNQYWDGVSREKTLMNGSEAKGRVEGKAEGLAEGEIKLKAEKEAIVKKLLDRGMPVEEIAAITELLVVDIHAIGSQR
jgi:predicted transposase/invertase (TIGR01784 family)